VETVFSGAGQFTEEARTASAKLLRQVVKLHYNYKYPFLRIPVQTVVKRYLEKHHTDLAAMLERDAARAVAASTEAGPTQTETPSTSTAAQM